ncbi:unnamed protein product [Schistosoma curassoni]|uniref:Reverse transcriptase domain-containing protein n=1 Tax=Schistosoma curassoni TaxID=6186 RepID=A0A183KPK3_9TREM|nr:unnamed protein product [Schistosoma curassoni]
MLGILSRFYGSGDEDDGTWKLDKLLKTSLEVKADDPLSYRSPIDLLGVVEPTEKYVPTNIARLGHHSRQARPPRQGSSYGRTAPSIFQQVIDTVLQDVPGVAAYMNDILIIEVEQQVTELLIDCFRVEIPITSIALSRANEFLCTTHSNCLGIYLWDNRATYKHLHLQPLPIDFVPSENQSPVSLPTR